MRRREGRDPLEGEYERYRDVAMGMLGKRFPRLTQDDRMTIYQDAWVRVIAKRNRGEEIESLRAYLLATCAAEALHMVSRSRTPLPVDPDEPLLSSVVDERADVEAEVLTRDQARLARDLIDSLDARQREVMKLRWDLQLRGPEVRAALGLTRRQYQRLAEQGAAAVAQRVEELENGTWSRKQRSLLRACLVRVTADGEQREGIASARQRAEAQRLLETDPHFAALYAEMRSALRRAAAFLPLPLLVGTDASLAAQVAGGAADLRERLTDIVETVRQQATAAYVRAADPTLLSSPRPGTVVAALAGSVVVGGGAFGAYDAVSKPDPRPFQAVVAPVPARAIAPTALPTPRAVAAIRRAVDVEAEQARPKKPVAPPSSAPALSAPTPSPASAPVQPTPTPQPTTDGSEFSFEN